MTTDQYSENLGDKYKLKFKEIGHGAFGIVYKGKNNKDGTLIAAKKVRYLQDEKVKNACKKELEIFQKIKPHRNIVQLLDHIDDGDSHWFIMELGELGNLEEYLQKFDLVFTDKLKIMFDCASAIYHLHTQNPAIVHRDIKPANVLIQTDGHQIIAKISDFGVSKKCYTSQEIFSLEMKTRCGTPSFMAPEWFDNNADLSPSTDIFSLGLLFQVLYLYDEGNKELHPLSVKSRRSNKFCHYGLEMTDAKKNNYPMPTLFSPCDSDPFYAKRLQNTIISMTEYEAEKRMDIQTVEKTIQSILFNGTGVRQLIDVVEIQEDQSRKLKAKINLETLQYLQSKICSNNKKLVVVSMMGLYRTGKSSLLNMWTELRKQGFDWKSGEEACTSGVWVYCLQQGDKDIILLDCQGTDDACSSDREIDVWMSLFSMLSSSVLVFNKLHNIDQSMFDILYAMHAHAISYVKNFNYPELCLLIRDFTLGKITDTNDDTTLESHFTGSEGMTQEKVVINKHFHKRKCFKLPIPSLEPSSVKEWSFGNDEISQKFQDGARQILDYITQEASCFIISGKSVTIKEWAKSIYDIASCLDYTVSDLRPYGEKVSINMTADDILWKQMRRLEEHLVDEVNEVQMLKETFEEPITDIETCILDEEDVNREVEQLCKEAIEHLQKYTNGMDTPQLDKLKLSQKTHEKMAEFISCTAKCENKEPDISVIQASGKKDETSEDKEERKLSSYLTSMKMDFMELTYNGECILIDDTVLEKFLKDENVDDVLIKDIMDCFRSFFFGKDLSGLPSMLDAIEISDEWTPWMKDMILYNLQIVIKILTEQQFLAAGHVLNDFIKEADDKHITFNRELTRWDETQEIEPTWGKRIQSNLASMDEQLKEQVSCILQNFILKIISTPNDDIQTLLQEYFTASINTSNSKAMLKIIFELLKKYQRDNTDFWQDINLFCKTTLVILLMIVSFPLLVSRFFNTENMEDGLSTYFKSVYQMSSEFYIHLIRWIQYGEKDVSCFMPNVYKEFRIPYSFAKALSYIEGYLDNNFIPIQKLDPVMKLMHYILLEDFCKKKSEVVRYDTKL